MRPECWSSSGKIPLPSTPSLPTLLKHYTLDGPAQADGNTVFKTQAVEAAEKEVAKGKARKERKKAEKAAEKQGQPGQGTRKAEVIELTEPVQLIGQD